MIKSILRALAPVESSCAPRATTAANGCLRQLRDALAVCGGLFIAATAPAADLKHHRSALPADVDFKPYKHVRVVRWQGQRMRVRQGRTHLRDLGNFEYPGEQNPHNTEMFKAPGGGLTAIKGLEVQKWRHVPGEIRRYGRASNVNGYATHHVYPIGTKFAETIAHGGKVFEVRCSHKTKKGWEFDVDTVGPTPPGYVAVSDCKACHQHAGKDSFAIPTIGRQRWWGYGWAPGDDFVISFDPEQAR